MNEEVLVRCKERLAVGLPLYDPDARSLLAEVERLGEALGEATKAMLRLAEERDTARRDFYQTSNDALEEIRRFQRERDEAVLRMRKALGAE